MNYKVYSEHERRANQFGYDDVEFYTKRKMGTALIFKKIGDLLKKHWKVIAIIVGILVFSGMLKRFIGRLKTLWSIRHTQNNPTEIDFNFMAMSVHEAMYQGLFNWGENEGVIISLINTLPSMNDFLALCRAYTLKYSKDLREQLRSNFSDNQYAKLTWK